MAAVIDLQMENSTASNLQQVPGLVNVQDNSASSPRRNGKLSSSLHGVFLTRVQLIEALMCLLVHRGSSNVRYCVEGMTDSSCRDNAADGCQAQAMTLAAL